MLAGLNEWMQGEHAGGISLAIAFAAFVILAGTNSTSITAISREGQGFFLNKSLPIPYGQLIFAKLLPGTILTVFSMVLLVAEAAWFIKLSPLFIILALLVSIPGILFINLLGIMVDLQMPKLSWSSEQEAVKQNFNPLFSMLFGIVTAGVCILAGFSLESSMVGTGCGLFILFALLDILLYRILLKKGPEWMDKMEV